MDQLRRDNEYYSKNYNHPIAAWREAARGNRETVRQAGSGLVEAAFVSDALATVSRRVRGKFSFNEMGLVDEGQSAYMGPTEFEAVGRLEPEDAHTVGVRFALPHDAPFHAHDGEVTYTLQSEDIPGLQARGSFATFAGGVDEHAPAVRIPLYSDRQKHVDEKLPVAHFDAYQGGLRLGVQYEPAPASQFVVDSMTTKQRSDVGEMYAEKAVQFSEKLVETEAAKDAVGAVFRHGDAGTQAIRGALEKVFGDVAQADEDGESGAMDVSGSFGAMLFSAAALLALKDYAAVRNEGVLPTVFELLDDARKQGEDEHNKLVFRGMLKELAIRYGKQGVEAVNVIGAALAGMDGMPAMHATNLLVEACGGNLIENAGKAVAAQAREKLQADGGESDDEGYGQTGEEGSEGAAYDWVSSYALLDPVLSALRNTNAADIGHPWSGVARVAYDGLGWGLVVAVFVAAEYALGRVYDGEWTLERAFAARLYEAGMISRADALFFKSEEDGELVRANDALSSFAHSYSGIYLQPAEIALCLHKLTQHTAQDQPLADLLNWKGPAYVTSKGAWPVVHTAAQSLALTESPFLEHTHIIGMGDNDAVLVGHSGASGVLVVIRDIQDKSQLGILKAWHEHTSGRRFSELGEAALPVHYQRSATIDRVLAVEGGLNKHTLDQLVDVDMVEACERQTQAKLLPADSRGVYTLEVDGRARYKILYDYAAEKFVFTDLEDGGYVIHPGRVHASSNQLAIDGWLLSAASVDLGDLERVQAELQDHEQKYRQERQQMSAQDRLMMNGEGDYQYQKLPVTSEHVGNLLSVLAGGAVGAGVGLATGSVGAGLLAGGLTTAGLAAHDYYSRPYYVDYGAGYVGDYGIAAPLTAGYHPADLYLDRRYYGYHGGRYLYLLPRYYHLPFPLMIPVDLFGLGGWRYPFSYWRRPYLSWFRGYKRRYPNWSRRLNRRHRRYWNDYSRRNPRWRRRTPRRFRASRGRAYRPVQPRWRRRAPRPAPRRWRTPKRMPRAGPSGGVARRYPKFSRARGGMRARGR